MWFLLLVAQAVRFSVGNMVTRTPKKVGPFLRNGPIIGYRLKGGGYTSLPLQWSIMCCRICAVHPRHSFLRGISTPSTSSW